MLRELYAQENRETSQASTLLIELKELALAISSGEFTGLFLVYRVEDESAGLLIAEQSNHMAAKLRALFVRSIWRKYGISRKLLHHWQSIARKMKVQLMVPPETFSVEQIALMLQLVNGNGS